MNWTRQRHQWRIREAEISLGGRTLVSGILDLNRFLGDAGKPERDDTLLAAQKMEEQGAALIDVTAQRDPLEGAVLSSDDELRKLVPVLRRLRHNLGTPVCVSTCHAATAERAIELGAAVIHDFTGLAFDRNLAAVINGAGAGLILGHIRGAPETWKKLLPVSNLLETVAEGLSSSIARARAAGIDSRQIVVDPGLGMGKRGPENYELLRNLEQLSNLGQPLQVGPSRKPFVVESVRAPESEWIFSTAAVAAVSAAQGAHLLRVHEVSETVLAVKVVDRMLESV